MACQILEQLYLLETLSIGHECHTNLQLPLSYLTSSPEFRNFDMVINRRGGQLSLIIQYKIRCELFLFMKKIMLRLLWTGARENTEFIHFLMYVNCKYIASTYPSSPFMLLHSISQYFTFIASLLLLCNAPLHRLIV